MTHDSTSSDRTEMTAQSKAKGRASGRRGGYLPFLYTMRGKRAGQHYLRHNVLLEDVAVLLLAFAWGMESLLAGAVAVALLHASFWVVYEIGYHENDHVAVRNEKSPRIPPGSREYGARMKPGVAWVCALGIAAPAVGLLVWTNEGALTVTALSGSRVSLFASTLGLWVLYLLGSRATFAAYNRMSVRSRGLMYAALQITRTLGYAVLLQTGLVGALLLVSLVFARWVPYLAYRELGVRWNGTYRVVLLTTFVILALGGIAADHESVLTLQLGAAVVWLTVLARRYLVPASPPAWLPGWLGARSRQASEP